MKRISWLGIPVTVGLLLFSMSSMADTGKKIKWLTVEKAWIRFKITGNRSGEIIRQYGEYGHKQSEVEKTVMNMMGMNIEENKKIVRHGKMITTQKNNKPFAIQTENPLYDGMVQNMDADKGLEFGERIAKSMHGEWNGVKRIVAKQPCREMVMKEMNSKICISEHGFALRSEVNSFGMHFVEEATEVRIGYAEPKAFTFPKSVEIRQGPNLGGGINSMRGFKNHRSRKGPSGSQGGQGQAPPNMEGMPDQVKELMEMFQPKK
jgi:hypothetical protein